MLAISAETLEEIACNTDLETFEDMIKCGFDVERLVFAITEGQWYILDGVPENDEDAAEWLFYQENFYDDDSDPVTDIPEIVEAIKAGEWIYKDNGKEAYIIATW